MTLIYHLQTLHYNFTKSKFEDFDFKTALKYCKLLYKDMPTFQKEILSKMENNPDLQNLRIELETSFEDAIPLTEKEILNIKNEDISDFAMLHHQNYFIPKAETNPIKEKFHKQYIEKIQNYLEDEPCTFFQPYLGSDLVDEKTPFYIKSIKEYRIEEQKEYIYFTLNNMDKLYLNTSIKYLVCSYLNIKEIELNEGLLFLDATSNQIKNIELNEQLQELNIASNQLEVLECNATLKSLYVSNNKLVKLKLNHTLKELICASNNLEQLELNECLEEADLSNNPLQHIKINKNLKSISLSHPENKKITIDNSIGNKNVIVDYFLN
jgi:hypothetical protein